MPRSPPRDIEAIEFSELVLADLLPSHPSREEMFERGNAIGTGIKIESSWRKEREDPKVMFVPQLKPETMKLLEEFRQSKDESYDQIINRVFSKVKELGRLWILKTTAT